MQDKIAETLAQVDLSDLNVPIVNIYDPNQVEYPGKYVARIFDLCAPSNVVIVKDTLEELQEDIGVNVIWNKRKGFVGKFIERTADDDPSLIGFWI